MRSVQLEKAKYGSRRVWPGCISVGRCKRLKQTHNYLVCIPSCRIPLDMYIYNRYIYIHIWHVDMYILYQVWIHMPHMKALLYWLLKEPLTQHQGSPVRNVKPKVSAGWWLWECQRDRGSLKISSMSYRNQQHILPRISGWLPLLFYIYIPVIDIYSIIFMIYA